MHLRRWRLTESFKWVADKHPHMQLSPGTPVLPLYMPVFADDEHLWHTCFLWRGLTCDVIY